MSLKKLLVGLVLVVVVPVMLGVLLVKWRVAVTLDRWIEQARPFATINRGSSFVSLNGDIGVEQVSIAGVAKDIGTLRAQRVTLNTPGLGWLIRNGVFGGDQAPQRFGISIDGLDTSLLNLDEQGPALIGAASGALFDHAGCQDAPFSAADLEALGLPRASARVFARYEVGIDDVMRAEFGVSRAGSAASTLQMRVRIPGGLKGDAAALASASFDNMSLEFIDEGFVAARNAACPGRIAQDAATFQRTNKAVAQRMMRAIGSAPDAAFWDAYSAFAARGGRLVINGMPTRPVPMMAMQGAGALPIEWQVGHDDSPPRRISFTSVRPVPMNDGPRTLAEQIEAEMAAERARADALRAGEVAAPIAPAIDPAAVPATTTSVDAVAAPAPADPPLEAQAAVPTGERRPLGKPGEWVALEYSALGPYVGSSVRVVTAFGSRREGTLERWNPAGMVVKLGAAEGGIMLSMSPRDVREIQVQEPPAG